MELGIHLLLSQGIEAPGSQDFGLGLDYTLSLQLAEGICGASWLHNHDETTPIINLLLSIYLCPIGAVSQRILTHSLSVTFLICKIRKF